MENKTTSKRVKVVKGSGYMHLKAGQTGEVLKGELVQGAEIEVSFWSGNVMGFKVDAAWPSVNDAGKMVFMLRKLFSNAKISVVA